MPSLCFSQQSLRGKTERASDGFQSPLSFPCSGENGNGGAEVAGAGRDLGFPGAVRFVPSESPASASVSPPARTRAAEPPLRRPGDFLRGPVVNLSALGLLPAHRAHGCGELSGLAPPASESESPARLTRLPSRLLLSQTSSAKGCVLPATRLTVCGSQPSQTAQRTRYAGGRPW